MPLANAALVGLLAFAPVAGQQEAPPPPPAATASAAPTDRTVKRATAILDSLPPEVREAIAELPEAYRVPPTLPDGARNLADVLARLLPDEACARWSDAVSTVLEERTTPLVAPERIGTDDEPPKADEATLALAREAVATVGDELASSVDGASFGALPMLEGEGDLTRPTQLALRTLVLRAITLAEESHDQGLDALALAIRAATVIHQGIHSRSIASACQGTAALAARCGATLAQDERSSPTSIHRLRVACDEFAHADSDWSQVFRVEFWVWDVAVVAGLSRSLAELEATLSPDERERLVPLVLQLGGEPPCLRSLLVDPKATLRNFVHDRELEREASSADPAIRAAARAKMEKLDEELSHERVESIEQQMELDALILLLSGAQTSETVAALKAGTDRLRRAMDAKFRLLLRVQPGSHHPSLALDRVVLAIVEYGRTRGRMPRDLDEVARAGIWRAPPVDPLSGEPIRWSPDEGVVWSLWRRFSERSEEPPTDPDEQHESSRRIRMRRGAGGSSHE